MTKNRLEAFSDGVIAILITIMVLELKVPHGSDWESLRPLIPVLASYVLSFVYLGICWNNHHHLLHAVREVNGRVLWANQHLLFWLSLIPFATAWMGENHFETLPVVAYATVLLFSGVAYFILSKALIGLHGRESVLAKAVGSDFKGKLSVLLYCLAIPVAFWNSWVSYSLTVVVAMIWLVPDRRIEKRLMS